MDSDSPLLKNRFDLFSKNITSRFNVNNQTSSNNSWGLLWVYLFFLLQISLFLILNLIVTCTSIQNCSIVSLLLLFKTCNITCFCQEQFSSYLKKTHHRLHYWRAECDSRQHTFPQISVFHLLILRNNLTSNTITDVLYLQTSLKKYLFVIYCVSSLY